MTYEGHSFERIIFAEARKVSKNIFCVGYQHAIIFKLQYAITKSLKKIYNPDLILTSGNMGKNKLLKSKNLEKIPIKVLGSDRFFKQISSKNFQVKNDIKKNNYCLVMPEGLISECILLFNFSLEAAIKLPSINFIWRLHPGINFNNQIKNKLKFKNLPKNIIISKQSLEKDFKKCNWTLYRGTSTIMQAVIYGLKPIYLSIPNEINIDPLYGLNKWHTKISEPKKLNQIIQNQDKFKWSRKNWFLAINYCKNHFTKFNIKILLNLL